MYMQKDKEYIQCNERDRKTFEPQGWVQCDKPAAVEKEEPIEGDEPKKKNQKSKGK